MSVTTVNGAEVPAGPTPGTSGVRGYQSADTGFVRSAINQSIDLVSAILTVVIAGATAYAGLNVMSSIGETMNLTSGDMFYNASQSLNDGISSFFTQMPTVFVVIALVLIIGYLTILRR